MALKGQKFSKYNDDTKNKILIEINSGKSLRYIAKEYNISFGTIATWTHKKNHPELITGNKCGRSKEKDLTKEDYKERYEILKKYRVFLKAQRERK